MKKALYAIFIFVVSIFLETLLTYLYQNYHTLEVTNYIETDKNINEKMKVHYIDVGQGDSIFIELPNEKNILIDAGEIEAGEKVVNYLKKLNIEKIDYLFATHPHSDHIGGLVKVINSFKIGSIYMPKVNSNSTIYLDLLKTIDEKGKKIRVATSNHNVIKTDDLMLTILSPNKDYEALNNYSIVLKLTYKNISFLFTGDIEYDAETNIVGDIKSDVLKVGHHGSNSSTSLNFLKRVNPKIAVISVGKNNDYGHPKEKIINRLKENNIKIYRTDLNGDIIITTDGSKMKVRVTNGSHS